MLALSLKMVRTMIEPLEDMSNRLDDNIRDQWLVDDWDDDEA